jgi:hypothetical protein
VPVPLRASVEWFDDQASPAIDERAKQAAVLCDEAFFEDGFVEVDIADDGAMQMWHPPEAATEERLARANRPLKIGAPVILSIGAQPHARGAGRARKYAHDDGRGAAAAGMSPSSCSRCYSSVAEFNDGWAQIS